MKLWSPSWHGLNPRKWQRAVVPKFVDWGSQPNPRPTIIRAITGSGKSIVIAEICACVELADDECIVVVTPSINLVEQLRGTISERLSDEGFSLGRPAVGSYYTHGKDVDCKIIVTCADSLPFLAEKLESAKTRCALLISDEAHTSPKVIHACYEKMKPAGMLGFTATPYRANAKERLHLYESMMYDYGPREALEDGVVVPWKIIPWTGGDVLLDDACITLMRDAKGPGIVSANDIADAQGFCNKLNNVGILAATVHSQMPRAEIKANLEALKNGFLRVIVHVAMLQQGADFPWLQWLCLRRNNKSRVRFVQEVGRVLRAYIDKKTQKPIEDPRTNKPMKPFATIFDPSNSIEQFNLTYEATLGGEVEVEEITPELKQAKLAEDLLKEIEESENIDRAISITPLQGYLREIVVLFDACGYFGAERKIQARSWRSEHPSEKQLAALQKLQFAKKWAPDVHRKTLDGIIRNKEYMTKGLCSDVQSVLYALVTKKKWPVSVPASEGGDSTPNEIPI